MPVLWNPGDAMLSWMGQRGGERGNERGQEGERKKERKRRKWRSGLNEGKVKSMRGSCKFTGSPLGQVPGPCCLCRNICEGRPLIVCWLSDHYKSRCLMPFLRCKNRDKESESNDRVKGKSICSLRL